MQYVKLDQNSTLSFINGGDLKWNIKGWDTDFEALIALRDNLPVTYLGFLLQDFSVERVGPNFYRGTSKYANSGPGGDGVSGAATTPPSEYTAPDIADPLDPGYSFSYTAEMRKKTQSIATVFRRTRSDSVNPNAPSFFGTAKDYKRAVNVSRSGGVIKVEGYEAPEPTSAWQRQLRVPIMTLAFKNVIRNLIGKKNNAPFYGSNAGEVVLWGCNGQNIKGTEFMLTFDFHERQNIANYTISPAITDEDEEVIEPPLIIPYAAGWDHVWVEYENEVRDNQLVPVPVAVYVEQIIENANFALLGIGG